MVGCLSITTLPLAVSVMPGAGRVLSCLSDVRKRLGEAPQLRFRRVSSGPKVTQDARGGGPATLILMSCVLPVSEAASQGLRPLWSSPGVSSRLHPGLEWGRNLSTEWGFSSHLRSGAFAPTLQFSGVGQPPGFALTGRRGHPGSLPLLMAGSECLVWGTPRVEPILIQFLSVCLNGGS